MNGNLKLNAEGYRDETAYTALSNIIRAERILRAFKPPKVYIASPLAPYKNGLGDTVDSETNVANALKYCRFAVKGGYLPIAPHAYLPRFMNDDNPAERELALSFGIQLMNGCRQLWVFGEYVSVGMEREINAAKLRRILIRQFNTNLEEMQ